VLSIDFEDLKNRLLWEWFILLYGARLYDVYNDFLDTKIRLDNYKAINRPRFKVGFDAEEKALYDRLLTLKRKLAEAEWKSMWSFPARKSYEREYLVLQNNFRALTLQQWTLGLQPMREKIKNRWAYIKKYENWLIVKVDIDKYDWIDHLAEFEISKTDETAFWEWKNDDRNLKSILKKLGLSKNKIVGWWSRKLFLQNWIDYTHFFT
jgi:adenylate cyclase class IV